MYMLPRAPTEKRLGKEKEADLGRKGTFLKKSFRISFIWGHLGGHVHMMSALGRGGGYQKADKITDMLGECDSDKWGGDQCKHFADVICTCPLMCVVMS